MSCCGPKKKGSARPTTVHFGTTEIHEITPVETSANPVCPETVDDGESSSSSSDAAGVGGASASSASSASASESLAQPHDLVPGLDVYKFCMITRRNEYVPKKNMLEHRTQEVAVIVTLRFNHGTDLHIGRSAKATGKIKKGEKYRTQQPLLVTGFQLIGDKDVIKRVEREFRKFIIHSVWDTSFVYKLDEYVAPNGTSSEPKKEISAGCGKGIHFFFDKKSAINYSGIKKGTMAEIRT